MARVSKNARRKSRRRIYHSVINGQADSKELEAVSELLFRQIDAELDSAAFAYDDGQEVEHFIEKAIVRNIDDNGWLLVRAPDGRELQIRGSFWDYVKSRRRRRSKCHNDNADVVESLITKVIGRLRVRHP